MTPASIEKPARTWSGRTRLLLLTVMGLIVAATSGCGGSSSGDPARHPTPTATATPSKPFANATAVPMAVTTDTSQPRWFILVNGASVPSPMAYFTPSVLTVNGAGPAGSPNPNGGTTVALAPLNFVASPVPQASPSAVGTAVPFAFTGAQIWQAVPGTQPDTFTLRSAMSFTADRTKNPVGSLMLGYGATEADLVFGYLPTWSPAIFLDQTNTAGASLGFEEWSYDPTTAQLTNGNGEQLYSGPSGLSVGTGTTAPGNQWYTLPNYAFSAIIEAPNTSPLFPAWTTGQQAAYNWVSEQPTVNATGPCVPVTVGVGANQQTGVCITGVRNEYQNANFDAASINTNIQNLAYPSATPSPAFAPADLTAVQQQLNLELTYVGNVQKLFGNVKTVMATVFWENSNTITKVVGDLAVSADAKPAAVPLQIVEGSLYALLSAIGSVAAVAANVMSAAYNTTVVSQPSFAEQVGGTVAELAGNLNTQFNYMSDALTLDYNTIVYDWTRLQQVGPATQQAGYWGLYWPDSLTGIVVPYLVNGYQIEVMKALLPLTYNLHDVVAQNSTTVSPYGSSDKPPIQAVSIWDFGNGITTDSPISSSQTNWKGLYNQAFWETGNEVHSYPSTTVMLDDLLDIGANPFEVFTGINGWSGGNATLDYPNLSCMGVVVTLFNGTPNDLWVNYTTKQGELSGPGDDFGAVFAQGFNFSYKLGGFKGTVWSELRPYGYSTMFFAQDNVTPTNQTGEVAVYDPAFSKSTPVAEFEEGQDGCTADSKTNIHSGSSTNGGYSWSGDLHTRAQSTGEPGGVWGTLVQ